MFAIVYFQIVIFVFLNFPIIILTVTFHDCRNSRVSVQGVKSLGGQFACLCRGFEFYVVKKFFLLLFFEKKMEILLHFLSFL